MKYKKQILTCFILLIISLLSCTERKNTNELPVTEKVIKRDSLKLLFVGDIMTHDAQINGALVDGKDTCYNFLPPFQYIKDYISSADIAFGNLETTLGGKPYRGYPMFSSPPELIEAVKENGFDVLFIANNHILDRRKKGLESTIDLLDKYGFYHTGAFKDTLSREKNYPLMIEKNNIKLALLNYTYDTNGLLPSVPNIVNYIDTAQIKEDLTKAKSFQPDYIIAYMHWGEEYQLKENKEQQKLAHFLAEHGTNLIIGTHPHVVQGYSNINTSLGDSIPIIYSLGNFISNQRDRYKDGGIAFEINLTKEDSTISIKSLHYEPIWVDRSVKNNRFIYRIIPVNDYIKNIDKYELTDMNLKAMEQFLSDTKTKLPNLTLSEFFKDYNKP